MSASEAEKELPCIAILCGGLAQRMGSLTKDVPKSMLEVAGEPFIAHQLRLLVSAGFQRVVLLCGHLGSQINDYVQNGDHFGCSVSYSFDGPDLLGTGGAVRRALPLLSDVFMLTYGDSYCPTNYRRIYEAFQISQQPALMTIFHNDNLWDQSNVEYSEGRIMRYSKTQTGECLKYIDYGVSVFSRGVFAMISPEEAFDLANIQQNLAVNGDLAGLQVYERFYEIGSIGGLDETEAMLRKLQADQLAVSSLNRRELDH
jgi:NDP-sugar pyrophosphorylase family protein